jgi:short-subunit dehydrogenase
VGANVKKVLITGAGSGIGKEFAKLFLADGSRVLAVSLLDSELETLAAELDPTGTSLTTLQMDLAEPTAAASLMNWCDDNDWIPDTLINNAGFACYGEVIDLDADRVAKMLMLNIVTLTLTSTFFGGLMKSRGHGAILNVGSTAGMIPTPRIAAYGASKSYVNSFTYALAAELQPHGVTVTCLTPGATQTNFAHAGGIDTYAGKSMLHNIYTKGKAGSSAQVAQAGYDALLAGRRQALVGTGSTFAAIASRVVSQKHLPTLVKKM